MIQKGFILIFYMFLLIVPVYAIGISPAKLTYDFEPGMSKEIVFKVFNSGDYTLSSHVCLKGDLVEYFDFECVNITLTPGEEKEFETILFLPLSVDLDPGDRRTDIVAAEFDDSDAQMGAVAAVGFLVIVKVPYEGQYLDAQLSAGNVGVGENVNFSINLQSRGLKKVDRAMGSLNIIDKTNKTIDTLTFAEENILPKETRDVYLVWNSGDNSAGIYDVNLILNYAGKERKDSTQFKLGDLFIEILDLKEKELLRNRINKLIVLTQSLWNDKINNVYVEVEISGKKSKSEMGSYKSWGQNNITVYFDTNGLSMGEYPAKVSLFYENKTTEKTFDVQIVNEGIFDVYWIYGLIAVALIVALFFFIKKRKLFKLKKKIE